MPQAIGFALFSLGASVAAVNAAITITSTLITIGLSVGLSLIASLLMPRPQAPKPSDVKTNLREPTQPRSRSYGLVRIGGTHAYIGARGKLLVKVLCLGQGPWHRFVAHYIDDTEVGLDTSGAVTTDGGRKLDDDGRARIEFRRGLATETAFASVIGVLGGIWSAQHRGDGMATAAMILKQPKAKNFQATFPNGTNTAYSAVAETQILHDPRTGLAAYSDNAALCVRDYCGSRWGLRLAPAIVAKGDDGWKTAADTSDEAVPLKGGGTVKRWRVAMTYQMNEAPKDVLQRMLDACDGVIMPTPDGGLTLKVGAWEQPTVTLDAETITGVSGLTRGGDVLSRYNVVKAQYISKDHGFEEVDADPWVNEDQVALYGENAKDVQIYAVPHHAQARRLMKLMDRRLNPTWRIQALRCNLGGFAVMGHRFVRVVLDDYGIDTSFEVQGQPSFVMGEDNRVVGIEMELVSMDASAYAWDAEAEEGTPPPVPVSDDEPDDDLAVPTGFTATRAQSSLNGKSVTVARFAADAPADEDDGLFFEVSSDNGASWVEVPHAGETHSAEYGPLLDNVLYQARVSTTTYLGRHSLPTAVLTVSAIADPPAAPAVISFSQFGRRVTVTATAAVNDPWTTRIEFRRGSPAQSAADAAVIATVMADGGDTRSFDDIPAAGDYRYWAYALNAVGQRSTTAAGPAVVTVTT